MPELPQDKYEYITLGQLREIAARDLGSERPLHISTVKSWSHPKKGKMGVVLKTSIKLGTRMTTLRHYEEFQQEVNRASEGQKKVRQQRAAAARDRLLVCRLERQKTGEEIERLAQQEAERG